MKPDRRLFVVVVVSFSFRCCRRCCRCCCCWLLLLLAVARLASFHGNWSRCRRLNPTRLNPTDEPKKKREPDELEKPAGTRPWPAPSATTRGENVRKSNNKINNNNNNNNNNNFTARRPACGYDTFGTKKNPVPRKKKVTPQKKARERERERERDILPGTTNKSTDGSNVPWNTGHWNTGNRFFFHRVFVFVGLVGTRGQVGRRRRRRRRRRRTG